MNDRNTVVIKINQSNDMLRARGRPLGLPMEHQPRRSTSGLVRGSKPTQDEWIGVRNKAVRGRSTLTTPTRTQTLEQLAEECATEVDPASSSDGHQVKRKSIPGFAQPLQRSKRVSKMLRSSNSSSRTKPTMSSSDSLELKSTANPSTTAALFGVIAGSTPASSSAFIRRAKASATYCGRSSRLSQQRNMRHINKARISAGRPTSTSCPSSQPPLPQTNTQNLSESSHPSLFIPGANKTASPPGAEKVINQNHTKLERGIDHDNVHFPVSPLRDLIRPKPRTPFNAGSSAQVQYQPASLLEMPLPGSVTELFRTFTRDPAESTRFLSWLEASNLQDIHPQLAAGGVNKLSVLELLTMNDLVSLGISEQKASVVLQLVRAMSSKTHRMSEAAIANHQTEPFHVTPETHSSAQPRPGSGQTNLSRFNSASGTHAMNCSSTETRRQPVGYISYMASAANTSMSATTSTSLSPSPSQHTQMSMLLARSLLKRFSPDYASPDGSSLSISASRQQEPLFAGNLSPLAMNVNAIDTLNFSAVAINTPIRPEYRVEQSTLQATLERAFDEGNAELFMFAWGQAVSSLPSVTSVKTVTTITTDTSVTSVTTVTSGDASAIVQVMLEFLLHVYFCVWSVKEGVTSSIAQRVARLDSFVENAARSSSPAYAVLQKSPEWQYSKFPHNADLSTTPPFDVLFASFPSFSASLKGRLGTWLNYVGLGAAEVSLSIRITGITPREEKAAAAAATVTSSDACDAMPSQERRGPSRSSQVPALRYPSPTMPRSRAPSTPASHARCKSPTMEEQLKTYQKGYYQELQKVRASSSKRQAAASPQIHEDTSPSNSSVGTVHSTPVVPSLSLRSPEVVTPVPEGSSFCSEAPSSSGAYSPRRQELLIVKNINEEFML